MKNKKVIRKKNESGKFTTINLSVLNDTRLSTTARLLLISILSDSDEFTLSQELYKKRLGIGQSAYLNAISNLEEFGYLRKTGLENDVSIPKNKKADSNKTIYFYTISEYGNLGKEAPKIETQETKANNQPAIKVIPETIEQPTIQEPVVSYELAEYLQKTANVYLSNDDLSSKLVSEIETTASIKNVKKLIDTELIRVYNETFDSIRHLIKPNSEKSVKEFKQWLKKEIFENFNIHFKNQTPRSKWAHISLIKNKKKATVDYETQMSDYYENPRD
ncbi:hypothetical protein EQG63_11230 [Flavobacterium amnicola]|uniref:Helix-turn-helix domain-containing protein n=1 Tax=Flavobacterium amnicola TaxID=2506422 RepID=A0A4Q1K226_9FLAO|nr:hypothetical protein [Flavobacterium amnicola]RXR17353.1 hypothetical protein EQG63_11230 [Flavobacterium amnicola]